MESFITVTHILVDPRHHDLFESAAHHLLAEVGNFLGSAPIVFHSWRATFDELIDHAVTERDVRDTVDRNELAELILGTVYGRRIVATSMTAAPDSCARQLAMVWRQLLPTFATDHQVAYFLEFVARRIAANESSTTLASTTFTPTVIPIAAASRRRIR
ncbi:MAG: hypothetical protein AAGC80_07110 [Rhodococcus sp. (in: high G+C Gram-positive bacteria)]